MLAGSRRSRTNLLWALSVLCIVRMSPVLMPAMSTALTYTLSWLLPVRRVTVVSYAIVADASSTSVRSRPFEVWSGTVDPDLSSNLHQACRLDAAECWDTLFGDPLLNSSTTWVPVRAASKMDTSSILPSSA